MTETPAVSDLRRHAGGLLGVRLGAAAGQAVFLGALARTVGPQDFVTFSSVVAVAFVTSVVCDLGVTPASVRLRAANPTDARLKALWTLLRWTTLLTVVVTACTLLVFVPAASAAMVGLTALWAGTERYCEGVGAWLVADRKSGLLGTVMLLRRLGPLVVLVALHLADRHTGLGAALASILVASAAASVWLAEWARREARSLEPGRPSSRDELRRAVPFWVNSIGVQVRQLDVVIVGGIATVVQASYYSAVSRLVTPLRLIPTSFATAVLPFVARGDSASARGAMRGLREVLMVTVALYVVIGIFAEQVLVILFGHSYAGAVPALRVTLIGLVFAAVASSYNAVLLGAGDEKYAARNSLTTGLAGLGFIAVGAHLDGAVGGAWGLTLSFVVQVVPLAVRIRRKHWNEPELVESGSAR